MSNIPRTTPPTSQPLPRELLITLLQTALKTGELKYARRLSTAWLAVYPGDLQVSLINARALFNEKSAELRLQAQPIVEEICKLDPEYSAAQQLLADVRAFAGSSSHWVAKACANALVQGQAAKTSAAEGASSWSKNVYEARIALHNVRSGDYQQIEKGEYFIHKALVENPDTPLAAVVHLRLVDSKGSMPKAAVRSLAQIYHERWPECLQFTLTLSKELIEAGESNLAVGMLHQAVSKDIAGQVARRLWGDHHRYASMWPVKLEAANIGPNSPQNLPIPAAVANSLGWNQIPAALSGVSAPQPVGHTTASNNNTSTPFTSTTSLPQNPVPAAETNLTTRNPSQPTQNIQSEMERLAQELNRPHVTQEDGRFPVYVVYTTRGGLESHYSPAAFGGIDKALKTLVQSVQGRKVNQEFWGSMLLYADDVSYTQPYNLQPAPYHDAWQLKLQIADLDTALAKRGERIGALLIVGGPEVVPFHKLPNPVEDADNEVPSDNPYAAKDNNYFISDWPVGRISGGSNTDPNSLLKIIDKMISRYNQKSAKSLWFIQLIEYIQELLQRGVSKQQSSFGYTAAVWQRASASVFSSIGDTTDLLVSPPIHACETPNSTQLPSNPTSNNSSTCLVLPEKRLAYFNLHGVPDGSEWYGQSDPTQPGNGPDFPVAIRPQDIRNSGSAPRLVFTEACYGANIAGKNVEDAISLKFLASGTQAVIGSTCISYGSITTSLSSADLLGRVFWSLLQEGFTAGEALRRAKISLTREMNSRQGYLDAEDQKTLISFVLFGDPLAQPFQAKVNPKIRAHSSDAAIFVPTICEHAYENSADATVTVETIAHLKSIVEQYLPGMSDAKVSLRQEKQSCGNFCHHRTSGHQCQFSDAKGSNNPPRKTHRKVVTLSRNFERAHHTHRQYARLTLDDQGRIIKMVVSH